jgi:hypothetical protein
VLIILLAAGAAGCGYSSSDDVRKHYVKFGATPPQGNRVTVCHAYSCKEQTIYTFSQKDMAEIATIMKKVKRADTPFEERRAVAYAIAHAEVEVGAKLGIKDRAGMQFTASGNPTQQDCVDEATNTTSYRPTPRAIFSCCNRMDCSSITLWRGRCTSRISRVDWQRSIR